MAGGEATGASPPGNLPTHRKDQAERDRPRTLYHLLDRPARNKREEAPGAGDR